MVCSKCGKEFGEGNFCSNCGTPKAETAANVNSVQTNPVQAKPAPVIIGGDMKACKSCGRMIAKNAKVCPACGAKAKQFYKRWWFWLIVVIVLFIIIPQIFGSDGSSSEAKKVGEISAADEQSEAKTAKKQKKFGVGEVVELNDVSTTLIKVTESSGSRYNKPSSGKDFVLCEFEIANNTNEEITVSSLLNFSAYCDDYAVDTSFNAEMEKADGQQTLDSSVAPGKKTKGVIGYELPIGWKELEIRYTPDWWKGHEVVFVAENK